MNDTMKYRVNEVTIFYKWWLGAESNCRHEDFQSTALPLSYPGTVVPLKGTGAFYDTLS